MDVAKKKTAKKVEAIVLPKSDRIIDLTEKQYEQLETVGGLGVDIKMVAHLMGMSVSSFYNAINKDHKAMESYERGKANAITQVSQEAFQQAVSGKNWRATEFWLSRKAGWTEKASLEITGKGGGPIEVTALTPDERQKRIAELKEIAFKEGKIL